ncbi:putative bifunctional diguanylate cyclase/phosphodiesterase [Clostridium paraputrificum]|uniref:putative bifunctional diguanylate cyclase/phosphodiesterase n=1 Tax=Clostridium TaxID=1485 RepID=UPI003D34341B
MKLMRKIALVFITVTAISSIVYYTIGRSIINLASEGELDRGPGRTNSIIGKLEGEVNKVTSQAREFGEYFLITKKLNEKYGEAERKSIINVEKNIEKSPITNMIIVDKNFELDRLVKINNIDLESDDISNVLLQSKNIMEDKENKTKGFFGGMISTENLVYMVGVKRIGDIDSVNPLYTVVISPVTDEYMKNLGKSSQRNVSIIKNDENSEENSKIEKVNLYGGEFYIIRNKDSIDVYTQLNIIGDGPGYSLKLKDDTQVRSTATNSINLLIVIIVGLTAFANIIVYQFVKKKVVKRVIDINTVVNDVTNGSDLNVELDDDKTGDEISVLTSDLNNMFGRLKNYSDNLEYIGSHDLLTGLINRHKIIEYISELKEKREEFSVCFIDLDNFKGINDTLGHNIGDQLLCTVSERLNEYNNENIRVSRFGGDEFILVRRGSNNIEEVRNFAEEILKSVNKSLELNSYSYDIKASMGISLYPQHSEEQVSLLQYSDIAMYNSKRNGGNSYAIFNEDMLEPLELEAKLRNAIENKELEVYYQPIYGIKEETIIGAEALIRWNTDEGMVLPDKFIPLAKKTGDIVDIDMFVFKEAINTCKEWIDRGKTDFYISINASKRFLKQKGFISILQNELKEKSVPSSSIKLEITEDEIIDDFEFTTKLLNNIREIGVEVYLDDFGTGYSSFNHIKVLPVDLIKIDRSFLIDIKENKKSRAIVETVINLCHSLELGIVCEGVENFEQVEILKELKCDKIQGFYLSRPLPKEGFTRFVTEYN